MNSEELLLLSLSLAAAADSTMPPLPSWPSTSSSQSLLPLMAERSSSAVRSGLPSVLVERGDYFIAGYFVERTVTTIYKGRMHGRGKQGQT